MSLLEELNILLAPLSLPVETGVFSEPPPDAYLVITPMSEVFHLYADNLPHQEVQEARLSLFSKGSYTAIKNSIVHALIAAGISITDRRYVGHEDDTGYHHFAIDVAKEYGLEE